MVPFGPERKYRSLDILYRHGAAVDQIFAMSEAVIEEQLAQVLTVHRAGIA